MNLSEHQNDNWKEKSVKQRISFQNDSIPLNFSIDSIFGLRFRRITLVRDVMNERWKGFVYNYYEILKIHLVYDLTRRNIVSNILEP